MILYKYILANIYLFIVITSQLWTTAWCVVVAMRGGGGGAWWFQFMPMAVRSGVRVTVDED